MTIRLQLKRKVEEDLFPDSSVDKITSGSHLLDKVLGGGWAVGRMVNIVGDRSSGKTLLAIEACANFANKISNDGDIRYAEAEAAFDRAYALSIGLPESVVFVGVENEEEKIDTVEKWYNDMKKFAAARQKRKTPSLYVLDSIDALSDDAEMAREIDKGSYGASKPKKISEMFRREISNFEKANMTIFAISQIRDKLNVTFGETKTRSGGHALDFYASQILWLAEIGKIKRSVYGVERVVGVNVLCKTKKNKVATPFRECEVEILFNYGVDDEASMINWLNKNKAIQPKEAVSLRAELVGIRKQEDIPEMRELRKYLREAVDVRWNKIEAALRPTFRKYGPGAV